MATIFTVGSSGADFTTVQAAFNNVPDPLNDEYRIQLFNEEFVYTGGAVPLAIGARTTTPTNQLFIEPFPGAGFMDNPSVRANPLRYSGSAGASIKCEDASAIIFAGTVNHLTIQGLQFFQNASALSSFDVLVCQVADVSTDKVIKDCIVQLNGSDHNDCLFMTGISKLINLLVIHGGDNPDSAIKLSDAAAGYQTTAIDCTVVRPSNLAGGTGIGLFNKFADNVFHAQGCAVFGFPTDASQLTTGDYCATAFADGASGFNAGNNVFGVPYDNDLFVETSNAGGNQDYRLKMGTLLGNAGLASALAPEDISGFTRGNPPDIGAWETGAAAPGGGFYHSNKEKELLGVFEDDESLFDYFKKRLIMRARMRSRLLNLATVN